MPVGVPLPGAAAPMVTVSVTAWPKTEGCADETTLMVELSGLTSSVKELNVTLPRKFVSPAYTAEIKCDPITSGLVVVKVALPVASSAAVPRVAKPSLKVTVPLGVPEPGAMALTVVVKVTAWP